MERSTFLDLFPSSNEKPRLVVLTDFVMTCSARRLLQILKDDCGLDAERARRFIEARTGVAFDERGHYGITIPLTHRDRRLTDCEGLTIHAMRESDAQAWLAKNKRSRSEGA